MSLDLYLERPGMVEVHSQNITHNLNRMAEEAGLYGLLWRPEENGNPTAADLIAPLEAGIAAMKADPSRFEKFNSPNGWGLYENFLPWLEELLVQCRENPNCVVRASR